MSSASFKYNYTTQRKNVCIKIYDLEQQIRIDKLQVGNINIWPLIRSMFCTNYASHFQRKSIVNSTLAHNSFFQEFEKEVANFKTFNPTKINDGCQIYPTTSEIDFNVDFIFVGDVRRKILYHQEGHYEYIDTVQQHFNDLKYNSVQISQNLPTSSRKYRQKLFYKDTYPNSHLGFRLSNLDIYAELKRTFKILNKNSLNLTLGLNYRRLSPAHGTAIDIKNKLLANNRSYLKCLLF